MTSTTQADAQTCIQNNEMETNFRPYLLTPILWIIAFLSMLGVNFDFLTDPIPQARAAKKMATTAAGLEVVYNYVSGPIPKLNRANWKNWCYAVLDNCYHSLRISQAVRNRHRMVTEIIRQVGDHFFEEHKEEEFRITSVGCGFGSVPLPAVKYWNDQGKMVSLLLIDVNKGALKSAMEKAKMLGIAHLVTTRQGKAEEIKTLASDFRPHLTEMIGVLEYFWFFRACKVIKALWQNLEPDGCFVTGNIRWFNEAPLVHSFFKWHLVYRFGWETRFLLWLTDFVETKIRWEPQGIFGVVVTKKPK